MDYVWDYGTLDPQDERSYINSIMSFTFKPMTGEQHLLISALVEASQQCIQPIDIDTPTVMKI